jgi:Rrf2 family protein
MLSATSKYALRALICIEQAGGGPLAGPEIAKLAGVHSHYLSKILGTLTRTGILLASRGLGGGYRLARSTRQLTLAEVLEPFEPRDARLRCLLDDGTLCGTAPKCQAHDRWHVVSSTFTEFLQTTNVADLAGSRVLTEHKVLQKSIPIGKLGRGSRRRA